MEEFLKGMCAVEGGYVFVLFVCLSVFVNNNLKSYGQILMKFLGNVKIWQKRMIHFCRRAWVIHERL